MRRDYRSAKTRTSAGRHETVRRTASATCAGHTVVAAGFSRPPGAASAAVEASRRDQLAGERVRKIVIAAVTLICIYNPEGKIWRLR